MRFTEVPIQLHPHIEYITQKDEVWLQRLNTDEVLDQLDAIKYDPFIEYNQIQLLMHNKLKFYGIQFEPITLGLMSYLYTIKSPFATDQDKYTTIDVDIFFYLLQTKIFNLELNDLIAQSMNYSSQVLKLTQQQAVDVIQKMFKISFRVLNMFPRLQAEKKAAFNADWITSIVSKVAQVSSYSTQSLYSRISLCQVYYLFAQFCREKGSEAIFLRTEEEILAEEDLRVTTLIVERLIELGYIDQSNKQHYISVMHDIGV